MNNKFANITKNQIKKYILPLIPANKRGFSSTSDLSEIVQCIIYKLKTDVQWKFLFIEIESLNRHFHGSWFIIIIANGVSQAFLNVFKAMFEVQLELQKDKLDTENLNLDGTYTHAKKLANPLDTSIAKRLKQAMFW